MPLTGKGRGRRKQKFMTKKKSTEKKETPVVEVSVIEAPQQVVPEQKMKENNVDSFITLAIEKNASVETMERLFILQKDVRAEQAREAFVLALASFQAECPVIEKRRKVFERGSKDRVRYSYAAIEDIIDQIRIPLARNGLAYTWNIEIKDSMIVATVKITHQMGHSEVSEFTVPIDDNQYMTSPQRYASAQTFAKRYALTNALGIATAEEDTDAVDVESAKGPISPKAKIKFLLQSLGYKIETKEQADKAVLDVAKLELVEKNFEEIITRLEMTVKEKQEYDTEKK